MRSTSSSGRSSGDGRQARVQSSRLVSSAAGRRGDNRSVRRGEVATVRLSEGHGNAVLDVDADGGLEIRFANFKGTVLGVVRHVVSAAHAVVNVLAVRRLIGRRTRGVTDCETERVSTNEAAMLVKGGRYRCDASTCLFQSMTCV